MGLNAAAAHRAEGSLLGRLNTTYHKQALLVYLAIVLAHWVEHLAQAVQIYVLGWERPAAGGFLGLIFPWLVTSEALHYFYAIVMLVGLFLLRPGFVGTAKHWWDAALVIQFWHHVEHALLLRQAIAGTTLFGADKPTSIVQLIVPRVELHLIYNALVFVPMVVAMYLHLRASPAERALMQCNCGRGRAVVPATSS